MIRSLMVAMVIGGLMLAGCKTEKPVKPAPDKTPDKTVKAPDKTPAPVSVAGLPDGKVVVDLSKNIVTVVTTDKPIKVDGKLDEPVWKTASAMTDFVLGKGKPAPLQSRVLAAADKTNLYLAVINYEPNTNKLVCKATARDDKAIWSTDDCVEVYVDANAAKDADFYAFFVTPKNVVYDRRKVEAWDGKWESATSVVPGKAWVVEMAIPWATIGMKGAPGDKLGLMVARTERTTGKGTGSYLVPCNDEAKDTNCYPTLQVAK